ncbi:MAG: alpha/beta hydrolase [Alphaproteobacteria bacterium]|nr:alpha/beta hydrolase [Alphaproteobacteria bacterium]
MCTITLSGWGQPHDALAHLAPGSMAVDYAHAANAAEAIRMIASAQPERVIGWSLGGQLAVRAVAEGAVRPAQLVLIATPYQFVDSSTVGRETFEKFSANYRANPQRTLHKAWELIHYEDAKSVCIADQLAMFDKEAVLRKDWLRWLHLLEGFSCDALDFSAFPRTLLVHGTLDKVVGAAQSIRMAQRLPHARVEQWEHCGHAPHLHDAERLKGLIAEHADV